MGRRYHAGMIPIAVPSLWFYLLPLLTWPALLALAVWAVGLWRRPGWRARLRAHPLRALLLFLPLAWIAVQGLRFYYFLWEFEREQALIEAQRHIVLDEARELHGLAMPAGTALTLRREGRPESFIEARFPAPVPIEGLQVGRLQRHVSSRYDPKTYDETGFDWNSLIVYGEDAQPVQGWLCDSSQGVGFEPDEAGLPRFERCILAPGNEGALAQAGVELRASTGLVYIDGHVDPDRWTLRWQDGALLSLQGMWLAGASLRLDAQRDFYALDAGALVCPYRLGPMAYPAGTRVKTVAREEPGRPWVFRAPPETPARQDGHGDVDASQGVIQDAGGQVIRIAPAASLGLFDRMQLGDPPPRPACPR